MAAVSAPLAPSALQHRPEPTLATITELHSGREVGPPPSLARTAIEELLRVCRTEGRVTEGPCGTAECGRPLSENEWAISIQRGRKWPRLHGTDRYEWNDLEVFVYPKFTIVLATPHAKWLLSVLENVKTREIDLDGRPAPWVPAPHNIEPLQVRNDDEDDAVLIDGEPEPLPGDQPSPKEVTDVIATDIIRGWFDRLARLAGFDQVPTLTVARGRTNKQGFTTGRVWYSADFIPVRVHLTTCPNSDLAEILATVIHELAHPLSRTTSHGDEFKRTMIHLAEQHWGEKWFAGARAKLSNRCQIVDYWLACGIRAAERGGEPPLPKNTEDGQLARIMTKIRKLRELACDQIGLPEGVTATATANDLAILYGLESYRVRIDPGIQDWMADRWVLLEDDASWRRSLAHGIADYFGVFSLSLPGGRMHFFGQYRDIINAEYLYSTRAAEIHRASIQHINWWRRDRKRIRRGDSTRERASFCEAAVREFTKKLKKLAIEESNNGCQKTNGTPISRLRAAKQFALEEHVKRGKSWTAGGGTVVRKNVAGRRLGRSMEIVRGISRSGGEQRRLPPIRE